MTNKVSDNWYEDFFQGINCELWEKAIPPRRHKARGWLFAGCH